MAASSARAAVAVSPGEVMMTSSFCSQSLRGNEGGEVFARGAPQLALQLASQVQALSQLWKSDPLFSLPELDPQVMAPAREIPRPLKPEAIAPPESK